MMSEPLPSGWHSAAPSEARRSIPSSPPTSSAPLPVFLVPSLPLPSPSPPSPPLPLSLALSLVFSRSPPSERAAGVAHRNKSKHHHGVVTGPRSHGGWISGPFLRSPGIITGPPWGFTRPEVRHQRDTCSTLTIIAPLSLSPSSPLFAPHLLSPDSIHVSIYSSLDKGFDRTITKFV